MRPIRAFAWSETAGVSEGQAEWAADWARAQECLAGDEAACTRLVTDHQRMVYQLSLHLLNDPQEALDLSQEVFLRVFRTLGQFRGQSALRTWIYRVVVTQASNRRRWWRRRHQSQQVPLESTWPRTAICRNCGRSPNRTRPPNSIDRSAGVKAWTSCRSSRGHVSSSGTSEGADYDEIATCRGRGRRHGQSRLARAGSTCANS